MTNEVPPMPQTAPTPPQAGLTPERKGLAITALVLGIVAILGSWIPFLSILSILIGSIGLVFGVIAIILAVSGKAAGKVMAIVGTALAALAIIFGFISTSAGVAAVDDVINEIEESAAEDIAGTDSPAGDDGEAVEVEVVEDESALEVVDQQYWLDDSGYWNYYVLIDNSSETAVYEWESFDVELLDADGVILDSDSSYPTVLPATEFALAGQFFSTEGVKPDEVAGIEVRLPEGPSQHLEAGAAGTFSVDAIEATSDDWSVTVTGTVESSFVEDQELVGIYVVAFAADGTAVAQSFTYIDRLPSGGKARFETGFYDIESTDGLTFRAWASL